MSTEDILQIVATQRQIECDISNLRHGRITEEARHTCQVLDAVALQICEKTGTYYYIYEDMCELREEKAL